MSYKKFGSTAFALALAVGMSLPALATWDEKYYNPKPSDDDVILPMPCDGAMAFRKVYIPLAGPLEDYPILLGQDSEEWGFVEHSRPAFISGSFTEAKAKNSRYYLLAKYEMTELQYKSLMDETCPEASNKLRLPVVSQSWLEAMQTANKYNLWLRKNAAKEVPKEDGEMGFLRLPTEVEWEFAARGGLAVGTSELRDSFYPMADGINAYEWFGGSQSANGKLQLAGLLKPNPLGLHDMLGNADEMMFEPFRLNKLDRLHGQAGGYVVRGGNFLKNQAELHTAARSEQPYYSSEDQTRTKTTGMRFVLVSPTLTTRERIASIEKSWQALGKGESNATEKGAAQELGDLASGIEDKALKAKLKTLENQLRASNQQEAEARDQAIRASLNLGAFLCTKMLDDGRYLDFLQQNYELNCKDAEQEDSCQMRKGKLTEQTDRLHKLSRYYASSLVESASLYGEKSIASQVPVMQELLGRNNQLKELSPYLATHWQNQQQYLKQQKINTSKWLESCKNVK
ncbi:SUMF1/EgtB/PvdO family nonheme iron enzyme [Oceanisphaera sp. W20_SRM_FM3]|uniref:SUMF1/EgtB/PvdO family nonheme iron enzyme n=1 Tax=Oceanisphaera sp. W20_SRM_FM3 TaxID=3240267 RepID=UPI003F96167D